MSDQTVAAGTDDPGDTTGQPYQEVTEPAYAEGGARFELTEITGGFTLRGACPRCKDVMEYVWVEDVVRNTAPAATAETVLTVICMCAAKHPGATANSKGCGAYWNLRIEE